MATATIKKFPAKKPFSLKKGIVRSLSKVRPDLHDKCEAAWAAILGGDANIGAARRSMSIDNLQLLVDTIVAALDRLDNEP